MRPVLTSVRLIAAVIGIGMVPAGAAFAANNSFAGGHGPLKQALLSGPIRTLVAGSDLGYTNEDMTRLISSCLARTPFPADEGKGPWQVRFQFATSFMGTHPIDDVQITLIKQGRPVASRWMRTLSPDQEPRGEFCGEMADQVRKLMPSAAG